jgi:hypothetical protein
MFQIKECSNIKESFKRKNVSNKRMFPLKDCFYQRMFMYFMIKHCIIKK